MPSAVTLALARARQRRDDAYGYAKTPEMCVCVRCAARSAWRCFRCQRSFTLCFMRRRLHAPLSRYARRRADMLCSLPDAMPRLREQIVEPCCLPFFMMLRHMRCAFAYARAPLRKMLARLFHGAMR